MSAMGSKRKFAAASTNVGIWHKVRAQPGAYEGTKTAALPMLGIEGRFSFRDDHYLSSICISPGMKLITTSLIPAKGVNVSMTIPSVVAVRIRHSP